MVNRHVNSITGVPLNAGQNQETVILPEMPYLAMISDGDEIVSGLPLYTDRLYGIQFAI